jgi:hypothetical protein
MEREQQNLQVAVRVRPPQASELGKEEVVYCSVSFTKEQTVRVSDENRFTETRYDAVFPPGSTQAQVYGFVAGLVHGLLQGYNASVFAYGQTGSGKTYTMFGENWSMEDLAHLSDTEDNPLGVVPRVVSALFQSPETANFTTYCSFIELYNEKIFDLLQDNDQLRPLSIREDPVSGLYVEGLAEYVVQSSRDSLLLMKRGEGNRAVRATRMNRNSSRSHCIYQLSMERDTANQSGLISRSKLNLCDLAGSEKFDKERNMARQHLVEMNKINLSLTTLGKVIGCLAKGNTHVPYRDSKLTRLLMDSLGGNTRTYFIATVSPVVDCLEETVSTLNFANRANHIKQIVTKNEISATDDKLVLKLQKEIQHLKELLQLKKKGNAGRLEIQQRLWLLTEENERLRAMNIAVSQQEVERLKVENKRMRLELQKIYDSAPSGTPLGSQRGQSTPIRTPILPEVSGLAGGEFQAPAPGELSPISPQPLPDFLPVSSTIDDPRTSALSGPNSLQGSNSQQRLQYRIREKHNLISTKMTSFADLAASGKIALRHKEELRRTQQRLLNLERMEQVQQERIRAEMKKVEEEIDRHERGKEAERQRRTQMSRPMRPFHPKIPRIPKPKPSRLEALLRESV